MKILLITEKWCKYNPNSPLSTTEHMLVNTLRACDYESVVVHPDEELHNRNIKLDDLILEKCTQQAPNCVVFDMFHGRCMTLETISRLRQFTKVVCIWFDTRGPQETHTGLGGSLWSSLYDNYSSALDLNILVDDCVDRENFITLFVPQDENFFCDPNFERYFDISFIGNMGRSSSRKNIFKTLLAVQGIKNNFIQTEQTEIVNKLSVEEYVKIYQTSKIGFNFCDHQMKSRAYEIMHCGAALISDPHPVLDNFFVPMQDYIFFRGPEDLVHKLRYFLDHNDELDKIRINGYNKVKEKCNYKLFWSSILDKLNF